MNSNLTDKAVEVVEAFGNAGRACRAIGRSCHAILNLYFVKLSPWQRAQYCAMRRDGHSKGFALKRASRS